MPGNPNFDESKLCQNDKNYNTWQNFNSCLKVFYNLSLSVNWAKMRAKNIPKSDHFSWWLGYINMPNVRPFPRAFLKKVLRNPIWLMSLCQNCAKMSNINRIWPKACYSWRWSEYMSRQSLFRTFLPCILKKIYRNLPRRTDNPFGKYNIMWGLFARSIDPPWYIISQVTNWVCIMISADFSHLS